MKDSDAPMASTKQIEDNSQHPRNNAVDAAEITVLSKLPNLAITKRWLLFASCIVLSSLLFRTPLVALLRMSLSNDDASYLALIPFICAWLLFVESHKIFLDFSYDVLLGGSFLFLAGCVALASHLAGGASPLGPQLSGYILALVLVWVAGFALLFPNFLLDQVIRLLQAGSAWMTEAFFDLFGVPALREGLVFHLARANIEVARECSGIRSSMALLILALLVAHFRLQRFWNKTLFIVSGLFMMILKNGIRIATLTLLAVYVDPSFLYGRLHHAGGIVFFVLALLLLLPVLSLLHYLESRRPLAAEKCQRDF